MEVIISEQGSTELSTLDSNSSNQVKEKAIEIRRPVVMTAAGPESDLEDAKNILKESGCAIGEALRMKALSLFSAKDYVVPRGLAVGLSQMGLYVPEVTNSVEAIFKALISQPLSASHAELQQFGKACLASQSGAVEQELLELLHKLLKVQGGSFVDEVLDPKILIRSMLLRRLPGDNSSLGELIKDPLKLTKLIEVLAAKLELMSVNKVLFADETAGAEAKLKHLLVNIQDMATQARTKQERDLLEISSFMLNKLEQNEEIYGDAAEVRRQILSRVLFPFLNTVSGWQGSEPTTNGALLSRNFSILSQLTFAVLTDLIEAYNRVDFSEESPFNSTNELHSHEQQGEFLKRRAMAEDKRHTRAQGLTHSQAREEALRSVNAPDLKAMQTMLQNIEQMVQGQERIQEMNALLSSSAEPYFLFFPALMDGFLSRIECTFERSTSAEERARKKKNSGEFSRTEFSVCLPALGTVAAQIAYRRKEIYLNLKCETAEAARFLRFKLSGLNKALKARGYEHVNIRVSTAKVCSRPRPAWIESLTESDGVIA